MRGAIPIEGEGPGYRREKLDYTKWQKKQFDCVDSNEFHDAAIEYSEENLFAKNKVRFESWSGGRLSFYTRKNASDRDNEEKS